MIGQLTFSFNQRALPCYVIDGRGSLIRCEERHCAEGALLLGGSEEVSTATELINPQVWTLTTEKIETRLKELVDLMPALKEAYPDLKVPTCPFPFVQKVSCAEDDSTVLEAIDLIAKLGDTETRLVIDFLSSIGIQRIPRINRFNALLHEAAEGAIVGETIEVLADGWMSHMKIYRKTVVR